MDMGCVQRLSKAALSLAIEQKSEKWLKPFAGRRTSTGKVSRVECHRHSKRKAILSSRANKESKC